MSTVDNSLKKDIRIQDVVAKISRVSLRDLSRVMRAMSLVLGALEDKKTKAGLDSWLRQSATLYGDPAPLQSKPDGRAINACNDLYDIITDEVGDDAMEDLYGLRNDPFAIPIKDPKDVVK